METQGSIRNQPQWPFWTVVILSLPTFVAFLIVLSAMVRPNVGGVLINSPYVRRASGFDYCNQHRCGTTFPASSIVPSHLDCFGAWCFCGNGSNRSPPTGWRDGAPLAFVPANCPQCVISRFLANYQQAIPP